MVIVEARVDPNKDPGFATRWEAPLTTSYHLFDKRCVTTSPGMSGSLANLRTCPELSSDQY
eukprot:scaffold34668_cov168-Amphora_coffeaeformis.AAC.1